MKKIKTFTFWIARNQVDTHAMDIRCKTKREVMEELETINAEDYTKPKMITIKYWDTMDLINTILGGDLDLD